MTLPPELLNVAACSIAWGAFGFKLPALKRHPRDGSLRAFCVTVLLMALAISALTRPVYGTLDRVAGIPNLAQLVGNLLGIGSGCGGLVFLAHLNSPPTRARRTARLYIASATLAGAALIVLFFTSPERPETWHYWTRYAPMPGIIQYRLVFLGYVEFVLVNVMRLSWRYARIPNRPSMQIGLGIVALGAAVGQLYVLHEGVRVLLPRIGTAPVFSQPDTNIKLLTLVTVALLVIGTTLPNWGPRLGVDAAVYWAREYRSLRRLYGLWRALLEAMPAVTLTPPAGLLRDVIDLRDVHFRLYRRVVEVHDAILLLNPLVDPRAAVCAHRVGSDAGLSPDALEVLVTAAGVASVLRSRVRGVPPGGSRAALVRPAEGGDFDQDVRSLERLADCYRHSRLLPGILDRIDRESVPRVGPGLAN